MCLGYGVEDFERMFEDYDALMKRGKRYALVVDFPVDVALLRAAERRMVADWWLPRKEQVMRVNAVTVTVLQSALLRGAYTALLWVVQPPNPQKVAGSVAEAIKLCVETLEREGVALPASLDTYRSEAAKTAATSKARPR
jgi:hypothetical protein